MRLFIFIFLIVSTPVLANINVGYFKDSVYQVALGQEYKNGWLFNNNNSKPIHVVTLDWPPYIGSQLCNKGWVFQFAVALLVEQGYSVYVEFLPWARAVRAVELGKADILMPEYYVEDSAPSDIIEGKTRRELLALSNPFPGGQIGFLKRKGEPDKFNGNLSSLKGQKIGVVRGYQNTPEFDAMMDNNEFTIIEAVDDLQLVKLLAGKRVDLIIGDPKVLRFTVSYSNLSRPEKATLLRSIENETRPLQYNNLYFALSKRNDGWKKLLNNINQGLYKFKNSGETGRIVELGLTECY